MLDFFINRFLCVFFKRVTKLGSNVNNGTKAGIFYLNLNNDSTNLNQNISSQLSLFQRIKYFLTHKNLASWQNTKQNLIWFGSSNIIGVEESEVK